MLDWNRTSSSKRTSGSNFQLL